jgi:hypothetical protein
MTSSARKANSSASLLGIDLLLRPIPALPFTANAVADTRPSRNGAVKSARRGRFAGIVWRVEKSLRFPCCNRRALKPYRPGLRPRRRVSGCSSGVEHNLAKVGVERSNRFTRSSFLQGNQASKSRGPPRLFRFWAAGTPAPRAVVTFGTAGSPQHRIEIRSSDSWSSAAGSLRNVFRRSRPG